MKLIYYERYEPALQGWTLNIARAESLGVWLTSLSGANKSQIRILSETKPIVAESTIKIRKVL